MDILPKQPTSFDAAAVALGMMVVAGVFVAAGWTHISGGLSRIVSNRLSPGRPLEPAADEGVSSVAPPE